MPTQPSHQVSSQEFQNPHPPRSVGPYYAKRTNLIYPLVCRIIVAVARKLLSIMRAMLLTGELFNEDMINRCDDLTNAA